MKSRPSDAAVRETLARASGTSHSEDDHLLITHTLRSLKAENPDIAEVGGENLTAFGQSLAGDDEEQNTARLHPAIRVAQERLLCATTVRGSKGPIVRRIQIEETKALDGAMHFQRVALDYIGSPLPGLLGVVGIQLDAVAEHLGTAGDCPEGHTIADAGIERG
jgi:hypothetical protein